MRGAIADHRGAASVLVDTSLEWSGQRIGIDIDDLLRRMRKRDGHEEADRRNGVGMCLPRW